MPFIKNILSMFALWKHWHWRTKKDDQKSKKVQRLFEDNESKMSKKYRIIEDINGDIIRYKVQKLTIFLTLIPIWKDQEYYPSDQEKMGWIGLDQCALMYLYSIPGYGKLAEKWIYEFDKAIDFVEYLENKNLTKRRSIILELDGMAQS